MRKLRIEILCFRPRLRKKIKTVKNNPPAQNRCPSTVYWIFFYFKYQQQHYREYPRTQLRACTIQAHSEPINNRKTKDNPKQKLPQIQYQDTANPEFWSGRKQYQPRETHEIFTRAGYARNYRNWYPQRDTYRDCLDYQPRKYTSRDLYCDSV